MRKLEIETYQEMRIDPDVLRHEAEGLLHEHVVEALPHPAGTRTT